MTTLLFFCLTIAVIYAQPRWHELEDYTFEQYCKDFGKSYTNPSELKLRMRIFEDRVNDHIAHNNDAKKGWKQGVNQFTDKTKDEYKALYAGTFRAAKQHKRFNMHKAHLAKNSALKVEDFTGQSVDWRQKGVITSVKDQGR
jgi:cathepsin L